MRSGSEIEKHPVKLVEGHIGRAVKVLEIDLGRLEKHKSNIHKYTLARNLHSLTDEQVNATRTVKQLSANVKQLEQLRLQVRDEDIPRFDEKTRAIRDSAAALLSDFLASAHSPCDATLSDSTEEDPHSCGADSHQHGRHLDFDTDDVNNDAPEQTSASDRLKQEQTQLTLQQQAETEQSWQQLEHNILELNGLMQDFSHLVHSQQEKVDLIEDNVDQAAENVDAGASSLAQAAKYKAALYPLAGALVGGLAGGPVGLVAGLKIGALAAVGGSVAGFTGGKLWQRKQSRQIDNDETNRRLSESLVTASYHSNSPGDGTDDSVVLLGPCAGRSCQERLPSNPVTKSYCCQESALRHSDAV